MSASKCLLPPCRHWDTTAVASTTCTSFVVFTARFFFSSRRRHTRLQGDWSSDVCSSDIMIRHTRLQGDWSSDVCSSDLAFGAFLVLQGIDAQAFPFKTLFDRGLIPEFRDLHTQGGNVVELPQQRIPFGLEQIGRASCRERV